MLLAAAAVAGYFASLDALTELAEEKKEGYGGYESERLVRVNEFRFNDLAHNSGMTSSPFYQTSSPSALDFRYQYTGYLSHIV